MSNSPVKAAFEKQIVVLPLDIIVPQKEVTKGHRNGEFYRQLTASLKHIGLIEPLVNNLLLESCLYWAVRHRSIS